MFPPEHSLRLIGDMIAYTVHQIPKWNPINICSYHLQEAGATPTQELAYALCTAIAVLDQVRNSGQVSEDDFEKVVGRISFFVNAGVRFVEETCKMRAFVAAVGRDHPRAVRRPGPEDAPVPLRRAGQLARPHRGPAREQRAADRARDARRDAVQERPRPRRPAAGVERGARPARARGTSSGRCGCSRCWPSSPTCSSTTTSSRARHVIEAKVAELVEGARAEIDRVQAMGGAIAAVESGYMKQALVSSHAARRGPDRVRRGEDRRRQHLRDHRAVAADRRPRRRDHGRRPGGREGRARRRVEEWKAERDEAEVAEALAAAGRGGQDRHQPDGRHPGRRPRRRDDGGVGRHAARGVRRVPRPRPGSAARSASPRRAPS